MTRELSFAERRVLGVLIEKGFTTPDQYPLTLNGVVAGSNQKSCREPVARLDEETVQDALDSLRHKGFVILVRQEGSRADRWKHRTGECLEVPPKAVALLAELLLRGPQTDGELRQRVSRMIPLESLEEVAGIIDELSTGPSPLVRRLTPPERKRGARFAHALYPDSEEPAAEAGADEAPLVPERHSGWSEPRPAPAASDRGGPEAWLAREEASVASAERQPEAPRPTATEPASPPGSLTIQDLLQRIRSLEDRVEELEATFVKFLR